MAWIYKADVFDPEMAKGYESFVYRIIRVDTGRIYVGKKVFWNKTTKPPLKGEKKKRKIVVESDWQEYYGSNKQLLAEKAKGVEFIREILRLCRTRAEASYYEAKFQFQWEVLESDRFYNDLIMVRAHASHLKHAAHAEKHADRQK